jgi:hypothetical protein
MTDAFDAKLRAVMNETFAMQPRASARFVDQIDRDLLDDAGANALKHIFAGVALDNHIVDPRLVQQLTQQ